MVMVMVGYEGFQCSIHGFNLTVCLGMQTGRCKGIDPQDIGDGGRKIGGEDGSTLN